MKPSNVISLSCFITSIRGPDLYLTLRPVHLFLLYKYASAGEVFTSTLTRTFLRSYSNVLSSTEQPYNILQKDDLKYSNINKFTICVSSFLLFVKCRKPGYYK